MPPADILDRKPPLALLGCII